MSHTTNPCVQASNIERFLCVLAAIFFSVGEMTAPRLWLRLDSRNESENNAARFLTAGIIGVGHGRRTASGRIHLGAEERERRRVPVLTPVTTSGRPRAASQLLAGERRAIAAKPRRRKARAVELPVWAMRRGRLACLCLLSEFVGELDVEKGTVSWPSLGQSSRSACTTAEHVARAEQAGMPQVKNATLLTHASVRAMAQSEGRTVSWYCHPTIQGRSTVQIAWIAGVPRI